MLVKHLAPQEDCRTHQDPGTLPPSAQTGLLLAVFLQQCHPLHQTRSGPFTTCLFITWGGVSSGSVSQSSCLSTGHLLPCCLPPCYGLGMGRTLSFATCLLRTEAEFLLWRAQYITLRGGTSSLGQCAAWQGVLGAGRAPSSSVGSNPLLLCAHRSHRHRRSPSL